jgi:hypothetical protein
MYCLLEIPLKYLSENIKGRREIDFVFYFDGFPTHYYEIKTEKDGLMGFKAALNSLFDLYTQNNAGIFHIILSAGMSPKVKTIIGIIEGIKGKSRISSTKRKDIRDYLNISDREFPSYREFFNRLYFIQEGNFSVDSPDLIKDGQSVDAIIKNMLEIPCNSGKFQEWPSAGILKDEIISSLLKEISTICSEKLPSKRKIERKIFLEKLTGLLARNKALAKAKGHPVSQEDISIAQKELLSHYIPSEKILGEEVDSTKEPSKP